MKAETAFESNWVLFSLTGLISWSLPHLPMTATLCLAWAGKGLTLLRVG